MRFFVDDVLVRTVPQGLDDPLQLTVDHIGFRPEGAPDPACHPPDRPGAPRPGVRPLLNTPGRWFR